MDNEMEFEIDLRDMLYRVLVQWRVILRGAVVIALLLFGYKLVTGLLANLDPEALLKAQNKYQIELNDYEATGEQLETRIENYREASEQQQIYNEKSALMEIDPMNKWVGNFVLYIDAKYQIDPNLTFQNTDPTNRILMAYGGYLSSGELYTDILSKTNIVDEIRFLTEILSRSVNTDSSTITVTCVGKSEEDVTEILTLVKQKLFERYDLYQSTLGEHSIEFLTESLYSTIDLGLDETQKNNLLKITDYAKRIGELNLELEEWEKSPVPRAKYGLFYVIKQSIKFGIIGGVAGVFVMAGYFAMAYVFSRSMKTDSDWNILGITVLGNLWRVKPDIKQNLFEKWLEKLLRKSGLDKVIIEGIGGRNWKNDEETQDRLIVNNLGGVLKEKNLSSAIFVSAMDNAKAAELVKNLDKVDSKTPYVFAGNVLEDPETVKKLGDTQEVILLGKRYETKIDDVQKIRTLLSAFGKSIVGSVVIEDIGINRY